MGTTAATSRHSRRSHAFGSLAGNRALLRVLVAYLLFTLAEYAVWIAMLVFAYRRGGTAVAGLVAVAQLAPAALVAPVVASVADRRSPVVLLTGGYLAQAAAMAGTAAAVGAGAPLAAYAGAVVAATAVTTTRPAQSALIPSVAATADQLTAANVVVGWMEAAGAAAAGLLAGVLISLAGVGSVFAVCAGLGLLAALLVAGLQAAPLAAQAEGEADAAAIPDGLRLLVRQPGLRLMLTLLTADAVVIGALDLLVVILALTVLGRSPGWAGYLQFAFGAGALLAATVSAILVGRRLGGPILAATLAFSVALAAVAFGLGLADPEADPVLRRADAAAMRARLGGPPPEQPGDYGAVLARVLADVLPYAARTDHPGYLAFIPSFTTWPAALAELTAVCFRREWPGCDEAETERRGRALADELERGGTALVSATRLAGRHAVRLCILNPTSTARHVRQVIEHFAAGPAPAPPRESLRPGGAAYAGARADIMTDSGRDILRTVPLLSGLPASARHAVRARGVSLEVAAGEEVIRRWDADRFFYIVLAGRYDVFIDARLIRTHGPGDHFGELAARDWGGGYGYARLATIRCAEPGRLLRLTSQDLQWLVDTQPAVKARLAVTLAERLQNR